MIFFYHYNKPLSKKAGHPIISLHYNKKCTYVENLEIRVNTWGSINKRQPYFVIKGRANKIEIIDRIAYIS